MPNFITKELRNLAYPFGEGDIKFLWEARGRTQNLVLTQNGDEKFFLVVKKQTNDSFVVKGEKLTKPAQIGLLQSTLQVYRDKNANAVVSQAFAVKNKRLTQKTSEILNMQEFVSDFHELSAKFKRIFVEIGFGSGRHLLFQAKNNQDALIIGIEVYKPSIEQVAKLARAQNLDNVRLINTDARLLLSLIGSNLIDKIFLHFPVPWDKAEHRRVVSPAFASECERVLKVGAKFELRTDSREYCDFSAHHFLNLNGAKIEIFKDRDLEISSKYEDRWRRQEKAIYDLIFTCDTKSLPHKIDGELNFTHGYDINKIVLNFKNEIIKKGDYFVHFEEIYKIFKDKDGSDEILLRVAFGAFNKPEQCFIKISPNEASYFIKEPIKTLENLAAHKEIKEYLARCSK